MPRSNGGGFIRTISTTFQIWTELYWIGTTVLEWRESTEEMPQRSLATCFARLSFIESVHENDNDLRKRGDSQNDTSRHTPRYMFPPKHKPPPPQKKRKCVTSALREALWKLTILRDINQKHCSPLFYSCLLEEDLRLRVPLWAATGQWHQLYSVLRKACRGNGSISLGRPLGLSLSSMSE